MYQVLASITDPIDNFAVVVVGDLGLALIVPTIVCFVVKLRRGGGGEPSAAEAQGA